MFSLNPTLADIEVPEPRSLLEAARGGDTRAFGELCRVYETRLLRHAMGLCGNASLAEELAQDTLVEGRNSLRRFNGRCQIFTWLCAILLNRYRNVRRKHRLWPVAALGGKEPDDWRQAAVADHAAQPDQAVEGREQAALLRRCIKTLPAKHQEVIYLRFYVDDSLEGMAAALGCSVGTVKSRLFHALEKLRKMHALSPPTTLSKTNEVTL